MYRKFIGIIVLALLLAACNNEANSPATAVPETANPVIEESAPSPTNPPETIVVAEPTDIPTATAVPPTPPPSEPLAALVNDEPIFISTFEKELARYEQAQSQIGTESLDENYRQIVLNALIERALISQSAMAQGIVVTPEMVDAKLGELRTAAGDSGNFEAWLEANQWNEDEFREALQAEMLVEQMVANVTSNVPTTTEQVRARYIQIDDLALAQSLLNELQAGADFAFLAQQNSLDRVTGENGGDLDYFARGSLLIPAVEEAAFALDINGVSDVISVADEAGVNTYYIVQLLERDPERPLTANMRNTLLQQTFSDWLAQLWTQATITRFIDA
ncbi:MAG: SurA N-terminal domain-containing protein [Chloroflexota bacterium]